MESKLKSFEDLKVWQKAHAIALEVYKLTQKYPSEEKFGLISQMRRSVVSVPANIVEGFKKRGTKDKANFYNIAQGSLEELKYYLILSKDLKYIDGNSAIICNINELEKMLAVFIEKIPIKN